MKTLHFARFTLAAMAAFVVAAPVPAQAQSADGGHFVCFPVPIGLTFLDPCSGEDIELIEGESCVAGDSHTDAAGGTHFVMQFREDYKAVGLTSGQLYTEHDTGNELENINPSGEFEFTFPLHMHLNTAGPDNDEVVDQLIHITFNDNGEPTAISSSYDSTCQ